MGLELVPVGTAREIAQLLQLFGEAGRGDPEPLERADAVVDLLRERLRDLPLLAERLGLLLKGPGQPGRRERPDASRTGRASPSLAGLAPRPREGVPGSAFMRRPPY